MLVVFEISRPFLARPYWFRFGDGYWSFAWLVFTIYLMPIRFDRFTYEAMIEGAGMGEQEVFRLWHPRTGQKRSRPR